MTTVSGRGPRGLTLAAQQGAVGQPNSLIRSGTIQPGGKASLEARWAGCSR